MTFGETLLWNELKDDKLLGFDFDRQRCIDNYIVDFYCKELMLAIEIDGNYHENEDKLLKDSDRQQRLEELGVRFIRFSETEVKADTFNVIRTIETLIINLIKENPDIKLPLSFDLSLLE
ncbi:Very-short-patch-repair endonuclease [Mucilaginibacter polytrichastri]|nr:Very-short-patch-repair endonuclease [Mucilaginibacter polytrichastri]